jgi:choline monooxygenase
MSPEPREPLQLPQACLGAEAHARCLERVFARGWHHALDAHELPRPGAVLPQRFVPGALDEPLVWTREPSGALHVLSNVCTHRANLVARVPGPAATLTCEYHGRSFDLCGRARASPGFGPGSGFPRPSDDLRAAQHALLGPLAFASLAPQHSFEALTAELRARCASDTWANAQSAPERARTYEFDANWALYVENYLEGLHVPFVHAGLARAIESQGYRVELGARSVLQRALARSGEACFEPPPGHPDHGQRVAAWYWWLYPATMLNVYPWGISLNAVHPLGPARTRVHFRSYVLDERWLERGAGAQLDEVELEDEAIVERVQRGLQSRLARPAQDAALAPGHEDGIAHFRALLRRALEGPTPANRGETARLDELREPPR